MDDPYDAFKATSPISQARSLILDSLAKPVSYAPNAFERRLIDECVAGWDKPRAYDPRKSMDGFGSLALPMILGQRQIVTNTDLQEERRIAEMTRQVGEIDRELLNRHDHTHQFRGAPTPEWIPIQAKDASKLIVEVSTTFDIGRYPHNCAKCGAPSYRGFVKEDCVNASCSNFTPS